MQQIWLEIEASCVIADVVGEIGQSTRRCHLERCEPMRNRAKRCAWMCVMAEQAHTVQRYKFDTAKLCTGVLHSGSAYRQGHEHILNVALRVLPLPHFLG